MPPSLSHARQALFLASALLLFVGTTASASSVPDQPLPHDKLRHHPHDAKPYAHGKHKATTEEIEVSGTRRALLARNGTAATKTTTPIGQPPRTSLASLFLKRDFHLTTNLRHRRRRALYRQHGRRPARDLRGAKPGGLVPRRPCRLPAHVHPVQRHQHRRSPLCRDLHPLRRLLLAPRPRRLAYRW